MGLGMHGAVRRVGKRRGAGAYQTSGDLDALGWARTATVPRGWDGAGKGRTVSPRSGEA
jgi:hypothetical protein